MSTPGKYGYSITCWCERPRHRGTFISGLAVQGGRLRCILPLRRGEEDYVPVWGTREEAAHMLRTCLPADQGEWQYRIADMDSTLSRRKPHHAGGIRGVNGFIIPPPEPEPWELPSWFSRPKKADPDRAPGADTK